MEKKDKKPKRPVGLFSFCPKHNVFFASCKCKFKKSKIVSSEDVEEEEDDIIKS